jgi:hypothetical protein
MYLSDRIPEVYGFSPCCTQASPDKGSHGNSARKRQERDIQYYKEEIEMNIKKKDRKDRM